MTLYVLDLREREMGGGVSSGQLQDASGADADHDRLPDFTARTRSRDLVVLLHGYNTTRSEGREALTRFGGFLDAAGVTALMLAVLWPGDGWAKALTYPFEGRDADDSAEALVAWLNHFVDPSARISFVAHSLGCRVAMQTAQRLAEMRWAGAPRVGRVCLMAAAIDNDSLGRVGSRCYRTGLLASERVAALASEEDAVLALAYPLGDLAQTILYFGERWGAALGRTGPVERSADVLARLERIPLSDPGRHVDHGDYLDVADGSAPHTIADADTFVASFLTRDPPHVWSMARR